MKRFLDLADLPRDEVVALLDLARRLQEHPEPQALAGKILGLLFFNPSLRTLASFQAGMARLGGSTAHFNTHACLELPGPLSWSDHERVAAQPRHPRLHRGQRAQ